MHQLKKLTGISSQFFNILSRTKKLNCSTKRNLSNNGRPAIILGIETSCDDTGIAIVDSTGKILGEALNSQLSHHLPEGGIVPPVACRLHEMNIDKVYEECLKSANLKISDVDAIATTVKPGLPLSLHVGRNFGVNLSKMSNKPFIPIHHMHAHALTIRMVDKVNFPFLVLLISGGHCLLGLAEKINQFKILGTTTDDAPGEAFDKIARRLKLINIFEYSNISGGAAIELAASKADNPDQFEFPFVLSSYRHCDFSFSGLKTKAYRHIIEQERKYNVRGPDIIPDVNNLCAAVLMAITKHLCVRTQRAMEFIKKKELIPDDQKILVVSGGVASNNFIAKALQIVSSEMGYKVVRPPPKLCTDNGIMVAWNGIEKYTAGIDVLTDINEIDAVTISHRSPIGEDWRQKVLFESIKRPWVKLKFNEILNS